MFIKNWIFSQYIHTGIFFYPRLSLNTFYYYPFLTKNMNSGSQNKGVHLAKGKVFQRKRKGLSWDMFWGRISTAESYLKKLPHWPSASTVVRGKCQFGRTDVSITRMCQGSTQIFSTTAYRPYISRVMNSSTTWQSIFCSGKVPELKPGVSKLWTGGRA